MLGSRFQSCMCVRVRVCVQHSSVGLPCGRKAGERILTVHILHNSNHIQVHVHVISSSLYPSTLPTLPYTTMFEHVGTTWTGKVSTYVKAGIAVKTEKTKAEHEQNIECETIEFRPNSDSALMKHRQSEFNHVLWLWMLTGNEVSFDNLSDRSSANKEPVGWL